MPAVQLPLVPFTSSSVQGLGLPPAHLRAICAAGEVRRLLRGVYVRADVPISTETRVAGLALVVNGDAVVCDRTAAWLWDVDVFRLRELDVVPRIETCVLRGHTRVRRPEAWGGVRDLTPDDWEVLGGVKVTTPLRTALDLGCGLDRREAIAAMDALARAHRLSATHLVRQLPRFRRRRGVVQLRELAPLVRPASESMRESWTRLEMLDFGLPEPELQYWVEVEGVATYRLDLAYPRAKIAIEYDGREHHTTPADRARDEQRRAWLRAHGWTVVVVRAEDLVLGADGAWLRIVREALAEAQRRPRRVYR